MVSETFLEPQYDSRGSFYRKAKVETEDSNNKKLYSYGTLVAEIKDGEPIVYDTYSNTTLRHIKEFLLQNGFKADNKNQIVRDYSEKKEESKTMKMEGTTTLEDKIEKASKNGLKSLVDIVNHTEGVSASGYTQGEKVYVDVEYFDSETGETESLGEYEFDRPNEIEDDDELDDLLSSENWDDELDENKMVKTENGNKDEIPTRYFEIKVEIRPGVLDIRDFSLENYDVTNVTDRDIAIEAAKKGIIQDKDIDNVWSVEEMSEEEYRHLMKMLHKENKSIKTEDIKYKYYDSNDLDNLGSDAELIDTLYGELGMTIDEGWDNVLEDMENEKLKMANVNGKMYIVYDDGKVKGYVTGRANNNEPIVIKGALDEGKERQIETEDIEVINPEDRDYYNGELFQVGIYPGVGYRLATFKVYADHEETALEKVVAYIEINNTYDILYTFNELYNIIIVDYENEFRDFVTEREMEDNCYVEFIEEYLNYFYVDATMEGASQPYYINGDNLEIKEIKEEDKI